MPSGRQGPVHDTPGIAGRVEPMSVRPPLPLIWYESMWLVGAFPGPTIGASTYRYLLSRLSAGSVRRNSPA